MTQSLITILGATGSIGENTLDVVRRHPDRYKVYALTAHRQIEKLAVQCAEFRPEVAVVGSPEAAQQLTALLISRKIKTEVLWGTAALVEVAQAARVRMVMAAIVGAAGLAPTIAAAQAGKRVLLANKEALVMSGGLFMQAVTDSGAELLPIDSEHNAIFQCLPKQGGQLQAGVEEILLTASGGPFRTRSLASLETVTPGEACAHPNWVMGRKISVDSATMMNKGLEVIEAHWLFNAPSDKIQVLIHPQSIVHSMVRYVDGSVLAQMGNPDMRTPIAYGMAWPERITAGVAPLSFAQMTQLTFETPDLQRFPALSLAFQALRAGACAPCVLNAANEVAVDAFLQGRIRFTQIPTIVEHVLNQLPTSTPKHLDDIFAADMAARHAAQTLLP